MSELDTLRMQCWDNAVHDFGTGYIFECRARSLRRKLQGLTFLGIIVPVVIGGIILTYGTQFAYIDLIINFGGALGLIQLIASIWALVAKWDDQYAYSLESTSSNYHLSDKYKYLAQNPPRRLDDFHSQIDAIKDDSQRRTEADYRQAVSEKEKRMGMRAALRSFQRECVGCKTVPISMTPSDCSICGNF